MTTVHYNYTICVQKGRSALLHAAWKGQASICRLLLMHGANVNDFDCEKRYNDILL